MTLNMPAFEGRLVHQLTLDVPQARSLQELKELMNLDEFIIGRQWYRRKNMYTQESEWQDRGDIIVGTSQIGKVVEFIDMEEESFDDAQRSSGVNRIVSQGPRRPIRP